MGENAQIEFLPPAFVQALSAAGFAEGRNIAFEFRFASAQFDRLPALAADLVRQRVDLIYAAGLPPALAAKAATTTIPIVSPWARIRSRKALSQASAGRVET
jgi:ABC-type uncharacterized transport system substrate-binding protein